MIQTDAVKARLELMRAWQRIFLDEHGELTPDGRLVLRDIEAECGMTRDTVPTLDDGAIDPLRLAVNEGRRMVFVAIKKRLFTPLDQYVRKAKDAYD